MTLDELVNVRHEIGMIAFDIGFRFAFVGSSTHLPPEKIEDVDVLVMVGNIDEATNKLESQGFSVCSNDYDVQLDGKGWCAFRKGAMNIICTTDTAFYDGFIRATEVNRVLNIQDKVDRVKVCYVVRDGLSAENATIAAENWLKTKPHLKHV